MGDSSAAKIARTILNTLQSSGETVVFAESCTAGNVAAEFAKIPGASNCLCGSFVTYRPKMKRKVLGIKKKTIKKFTTESKETASEMAIGALQRAEADWAVSVVGHFGPNAPQDKDGKIWITVAHRTKKGKIKCKSFEEQLAQGSRIARCKEATFLVLTALGKLVDQEEIDESQGVCTDAVGAS